MRVLYVLRFAATAVAGLIIVCVSFSSAQAASTVVNVNVNGVVASDTTSTICPYGSTVYNERAWGFINPSVSVQYEAQVEDASGQVISFLPADRFLVVSRLH
jgi:hypothetical protein